MRLTVIALVSSLASSALAEAPRPGYELRVQPASVEIAAGEGGAISLTIAPRPGHSIHREAPLSIELAVAPAQGLALVQTRYRRADAADAHAEAPRFDLRFRAADPGEYRLGLDARFWVCRRHTCRDVREERSIPIRVRAPAPPPPADATAPQ